MHFAIILVQAPARAAAGQPGEAALRTDCLPQEAHGGTLEANPAIECDGSSSPLLLPTTLCCPLPNPDSRAHNQVAHLLSLCIVRMAKGIIQ